jgi:hypothetical protein
MHDGLEVLRPEGNWGDGKVATPTAPAPPPPTHSPTIQGKTTSTKNDIHENCVKM